MESTGGVNKKTQKRKSLGGQEKGAVIATASLKLCDQVAESI